MVRVHTMSLQLGSWTSLSVSKGGVVAKWCVCNATRISEPCAQAAGGLGTLCDSGIVLCDGHGEAGGLAARYALLHTETYRMDG